MNGARITLVLKLSYPDAGSDGVFKPSILKLSFLKNDEQDVMLENRGELFIFINNVRMVLSVSFYVAQPN